MTIEEYIVYNIPLTNYYKKVMDTDLIDELSNLPKMIPKGDEEKNLMKTYLSEGYEESNKAPKIVPRNLKRKCLAILASGVLILFLSSNYFTACISKLLPELYHQEIARTLFIFVIVTIMAFFI